MLWPLAQSEPSTTKLICVLCPLSFTLCILTLSDFSLAFAFVPWIICVSAFIVEVDAASSIPLFLDLNLEKD